MKKSKTVSLVSRLEQRLIDMESRLERHEEILVEMLYGKVKVKFAPNEEFQVKTEGKEKWFHLILKNLKKLVGG